MVQTRQLDFSVVTAGLREQIDAALAEFAGLGPGCPDELREAIRYSLLAPGKRLRPMLALMAAEACGGSHEAAMPVACAVEMVHAYSLVHDDLPAMDDDDLRRGRPTCHKQFGEAVAILAGDALLAMAFGAIARGVKRPERAAACCAALAEAVGPCELVGGQADDIAAQQAGQSAPSIDALESIHLRKTGAMIRVSLRLGGLAAGASEGQLAALDEYGWRLGLAFQITDDLLDVRSSEAATGKRVGKDASLGKLTYPGVFGIEESEHRAVQLIEEACRAIGGLGPAAGRLEALARYVVERDR